MSRIEVGTARMPSHRIVALASVLVVVGASAAMAQGWPQQSNAVQSNPWQQQQQQPSNACTGFVPIRAEAEKVVAALNEAQQRKAPREEFCTLFQRLSASTGKMVKFLESHKTQCNVPNEALQNAKVENSRTLTMRKQACTAQPASAATPSLSDVLGSPILPETQSNKPDMGTFNTLTGNPLTR